MKQKKTHREHRIEEIGKLVDRDFQIPKGLYIPVGQEVLVQEVAQPEFTTPAGLLIPGTNDLMHAKIGIVYNFGEDVTLPIAPGIKIAFEKSVKFGVAHNGKAYLCFNSVFVKAILPPDNYLSAHVLDNVGLRRASRRESMSIASKKTDENLERIENNAPVIP